MKLQDFYCDRIFEFVKKYSPQIFDYLKERGEKSVQSRLRQIIKKHMEYNTIVALWDGGEVVGVATFNIDHENVHVVYCAIHPEYRWMHILERMVWQGHLRYPFVKTITFQRWFKHRTNKTHKLPIDRFLKYIRTPQGV